MGLTRIRAEQISDIDYKQAVRVITLTDITLTSGAPATVDGVSLIAGDRVLVAGQSNAAQNGLYQVQTLGTGSDGTWVRTSDGNEDGEIQPGMVVMVTQGTEYADTPWKLITNGVIEIGVTELTFAENYSLAFGNIFANGTAVIANVVSAAITFEAGNNVSIVGNNTTKTVTIAATGGGGTPGGANTEVQFNDSGAFGGTAGFTFDKTNNVVSVTGNITTGNILTDGYYYANGDPFGGGGGGGNSFANLGVVDTVTYFGQDSPGNRIIADSTGVLNFTPGDGVLITTDAGNLTATFELGIPDINYQLITESITLSNNWGLITDAANSEFSYGFTATAQSSLVSKGGVSAQGLITTLGNIIGNSVLANTAVISGDTEITGNIVVAGAAEITGNIVVAGAAEITGNIITGGIVTDGYYFANGDPFVAAVSLSAVTESIIPAIDVTYDLGNATNRWRDLYLSNTSIFLGNANISAEGDTLLLPTTVQIGTATISGEGGSLSLPENVSATSLTATGNITASNVVATDTVSVTGNVTVGGFYIGSRTISANTTIGNVNAMIPGPITIENGITVTVQSGGEWSIV